MATIAFVCLFFFNGYKVLTDRWGVMSHPKMMQHPDQHIPSGLAAKRALRSPSIRKIGS